MACQSPVLWEDAPGGLSISDFSSVVEVAPIICFSSFDRFLKFSRAERPDGSLLAFAQGYVSPFIHAITAWLSLFPSSCTNNPIGSSCEELSLSGRLLVFHVPREYQDGLGSASPPVVCCLRQRNRKPPILTTYLLVQACQHLWLVAHHDVYQQFTMC